MNIEQARSNMITQQIRTTGVLDMPILDLLKNTPREAFVPIAHRDLAFADLNVPLGHGQMMMTPTEEARIIQALQVQPTDHVLEIGTGSGYLTALLAKQAYHVDSIDIFPEFTALASKKLATLDIDNVSLITADATCDFDKQPIYNVIVVTGSVPFLPAAWREKLALNGRLFAVTGQSPLMEATLWTNLEHGYVEQRLFETVVLPLVSAPQMATASFTF